MADIHALADYTAVSVVNTEQNINTNDVQLLE